MRIGALADTRITNSDARPRVRFPKVAEAMMCLAGTTPSQHGLTPPCIQAENVACASELGDNIEIDPMLCVENFISLLGVA